MKKNLATNGNSWMIYINKPIAKMLGIKPEERMVMLNIRRNILYVTKTTDVSTENANIKRLIKRGGGYALTLPIPILELLNINPEIDSVEINVEENKLIIEKAKN